MLSKFVKFYSKKEFLALIKISTLILFFIWNLNSTVLVSFAENDETITRPTVLPETEKKVSDCKTLMNYVAGHSQDVKNFFAGRDEAATLDTSSGVSGDVTVNDILGCGIKTGNIRLWMIPYYIRYILEFIIQIGGLIAVGGIIYGGYLYLFAGISEDKDRGKKALMYSLGGMVLTLVAWAFVNIIIAIVTA